LCTKVVDRGQLLGRLPLHRLEGHHAAAPGQLPGRRQGLRGSADPNHSGGELLYVAPGGIVRLNARASAFAYVRVPVYQRVIGYQLVPTYTASVGVNYRL